MKFKKQLTVFLVLALVLSMLPTYVFAQSANVSANVTNGETLPSTNVTTPPAITMPSGSLSIEVSTFEDDTINFNSTHNFQIDVHFSDAAIATGLMAAIEYEWVRNSNVFSTGSISTDRFNPGHGRARLQLRGGTDRAGLWEFRVMALCADGNVIYYATVGPITLNVRGGAVVQPPPPTPPVTIPTPPTAPPPVVVIVQPPRVTVVNVAIVNTIINTTIRQSVSAGTAPVVNINLRNGQSGVVVTGRNINTLIQHRGSLVINHPTTNVTFTYTQMATWSVDTRMNLTVDVREIRSNEEVEQVFIRSRRKPRRFTTTTQLQEIFLTTVQEVTVSIRAEEQIEYSVSVNINNLGLTAEQKELLVGLFFYLEDVTDLYSLVYRFVQGEFDEYGYFTIPVFGDGWFTLVLSDPADTADYDTEYVDASDDEDDQDEDDQGEDN